LDWITQSDQYPGILAEAGQKLSFEVSPFARGERKCFHRKKGCLVMILSSLKQFLKQRMAAYQIRVLFGIPDDTLHDLKGLGVSKPAVRESFDMRSSEKVNLGVQRE
jgi:hypothetical protein